MTIQSNGEISIGNVQTEFGGTDPAALGNYYRGGSLVPINTTSNAVGGIPASGVLPLGSFYSSYKPASNVSVHNNLTSLIGRNYLTSRASILGGKEASSVLSAQFTGGGAGASQLATTVTGNLFFDSNYTLTNMPNLNKTTWTTIVTKNITASAHASLYDPHVYVNGTRYYPTTTFGGHYALNGVQETFTIYQVAIPLHAISHITGYYFRNGGGLISAEEMFILPGKWYLYTRSWANTSITAGGILAGDYVFTSSSATAQQVASPTQPNLNAHIFYGVSMLTNLNRYRYGAFTSTGGQNSTPRYSYTTYRSYNGIALANGTVGINFINSTSGNLHVMRMQHS